MWFGGDVDDFHSSCIQSWQNLGYEVRILGLDYFKSTPHFDLISSLVHEGKYAFASDLARYQELYDNGGIYLDADMELLRRFSFSNHYGHVGLESRDYCATGFMQFPKEHSAIADILEQTVKLFERRLFISSPKVVTEVFRRYEESGEVMLLPIETFYPYNPYDSESLPYLLVSTLTVNTVGIHHYNKPSLKWKYSLYDRLRLKLLSWFI